LYKYLVDRLVNLNFQNKYFVIFCFVNKTKKKYYEFIKIIIMTVYDTLLNYININLKIKFLLGTNKVCDILQTNTNFKNNLQLAVFLNIYCIVKKI